MGIVSAVGLFLPLLLTPGNFAPQPNFISGSSGTDISYPNCRTAVPRATFGVVGVTGGRVYTLNSCLKKQAMYFSTPGLYINTGWNSKAGNITPDSPKKCAAGDDNCLAYDFGYNAGALAYDTANHDWIRSNMWWLDVETANSWSDDVTQNRNSLQGEFDALMNRGVAMVGAYSTTYQ